MTRNDKLKFVIEFGKIKPETNCSVTDSSNCFIPRKSFDYLKEFVIGENGYSNEIDKVFRYSARKGDEFISTKNYVGLIETRDGTIIEILPKVYFNNESDYYTRVEQTRRIFIKMLSCLEESPFKNIDVAHIQSQRFPILEIFISAFIAEFELLLKKGIKQAYQTKEENLNYFKSRLLVNQNIKANLVNRARFYVEYDEFQFDIPQNRIIKSAIKYLEKKTISLKNRSRLFSYLNFLDEIPESTNFEADFNKVTQQNRLFAHYQQLLEWAHIFLMGNSFTTYRGKSINKAILFPMEKIFEAYISAGIQRFVKGYKLKKQDRKYHLIDKHDGQSRFRLIPDNVLRNDQEVIILDTKWKLIDQSKVTKNYLIDSSDMYQMYAYAEKYMRKECIKTDDKEEICKSYKKVKTIKLYLLYPTHKDFNTPLEAFTFHEDSSPIELNVLPVNLDCDLQETIRKLNLSS